ncbi:TPA: hypothetical protein DDW35_08025 [Candidatus Sumerlaeota bacterium]|jgi:predicted ferric reductase|nr:hypothetical protein [Candidatus Sumerlaeota bacterium]
MKKTALWLFLALNLLFVIGCWAWNHTHAVAGNMLTMSTDTLLQALGRLAGLLAAFTILVQLLLIGRVSWIEQVFGLDRLSRTHHYTGILVAVFLLAHPTLLEMAHDAYGQDTVFAQLMDFLKNYEDVAKALIAAILFFTVVLFTSFIIRHKLRYETWHIAHLAAYIALALAFGHQINWGDTAMNPVFYYYWIGLYVFVLGNLLLYRFVRPLWLFQRHHFVVERVEREASDVTSVYITGRNLQNFHAQSGQFLIVQFWTPGFRTQAHPFSLSQPPDGKSLRLSIKGLGDFTKRIPELKPGTPVIVDGAHGIFTPRRATRKKALLLAGGIGITPIRSVAEDLARAGHEVKVLHANRTLAQVVFAREWVELTQKLPNLHVTYVFSDDPAAEGEHGFIDIDRIKHLVPDFLERDIYLCGPPPMMQLTVAFLKKAGGHSNQIYYERFAL